MALLECGVFFVYDVYQLGSLGPSSLLPAALLWVCGRLGAMYGVECPNVRSRPPDEQAI
jgi:hypothetical protein